MVLRAWVVEVVGVGGSIRADSRVRGTIRSMTAKEKLLREAPKWSEHEAEIALRAVERKGDPVIRRLHEAPFEDEEISPEEEAAVREAHEELAAGTPTVPLDEVKRKYGLG